MKIYTVTRIEKVLSEYIVEAKSNKEAIEIAQNTDYLNAKEEVIDATYSTRKCDNIKGRIIYTKNGYRDADGREYIVEREIYEYE